MKIPGRWVDNVNHDKYALVPKKKSQQAMLKQSYLQATEKLPFFPQEQAGPD